MDKHIAVVIPVLNEIDSVPVLAGQLVSLGLYPIFCDGGSTDGTLQWLERFANWEYCCLIVNKETERWPVGPATRRGMRLALVGGFTHIITMDAGGAHDPIEALTLTVPFRNNNIPKTGALVIGSRFVAGGRFVDHPAWRCALSRYGSLFLRLYHGLKVQDCTSGLRCYDRQAARWVVERATRSKGGYAFQIESLLAVHKSRAVPYITEIPITYRGSRTSLNRKFFWEALRIACSKSAGAPGGAGAFTNPT